MTTYDIADLIIFDAAHTEQVSALATLLTDFDPLPYPEPDLRLDAAIEALNEYAPIGMRYDFTEDGLFGLFCIENIIVIETDETTATIYANLIDDILSNEYHSDFNDTGLSVLVNNIPGNFDFDDIMQSTDFMWEFDSDTNLLTLIFSYDI